jgi:uncharacterized membrane protein HdeD (DUF308 family)
MGLRGLVAVLFGILAFAWPGMTIKVLIVFFGAFVFIDGLFTLVSALMHRVWQQWWAFLIEGLMSIIAGDMLSRSIISVGEKAGAQV